MAKYNEEKFDSDLFYFNDLLEPDEYDKNTDYDLENINNFISNDDDFDVEASDFNEHINKIINKIPDKKPRKKEPSIHKDHRKRVREKFLKFGLDPFSDFEVLEMLLFYSIKQKDTNPLAHALIKRFGSINAVFNADYHELIEVDGISDVSASLIIFYRELYKYLGKKVSSGLYLRTSREVGKFCCNYFTGHVEENMILLSMDSNKKLISVDVISRGTENETAFYPRRIMKAVIKNRANVIILAHNHPSDNPNPSTNDLILTNSISKLLDGFGVQVIDHIICCGNRHISFSDEGYLKY